MFHNVLMTSLTPIRNTNEILCWENRAPNTVWPEPKQDKNKDSSVKKTIKKKKRNRTMFTTEQVKVLEKVFARSKYIDVERRREISECLQIEQKCIKIWFQNRRMKEKKELSESCDSVSDSVADSLSPPPESVQNSNNDSDQSYTHQHVNSYVRPQYYYDVPNNYLKSEHQSEHNNYETSIIPNYFNYNYNDYDSNVLKNNTDYMAQYYQPQTENQYYYNAGEVPNQCLGSNVSNWPANILDTSYFQYSTI